MCNPAAGRTFACVRLQAFDQSSPALYSKGKLLIAFNLFVGPRICKRSDGLVNSAKTTLSQTADYQLFEEDADSGLFVLSIRTVF
jgi:hypothetical protein